MCWLLNSMYVYITLLKTTIVATLWNNLSCKLKVMAQFLYILYITVNVVTCAKQKSMYSHVSTLTFDQHQFHNFFFVLWNCKFVKVNVSTLILTPTHSIYTIPWERLQKFLRPSQKSWTLIKRKPSS